MDYFNNVLTTFLGFERGSRGAVYGGSESSQISSKILCSEDEQRSYGFKTTWGWVINDRIFIFGWTIPLMSFFLVSIWMSVVYSLSGLIPVSVLISGSVASRPDEKVWVSVLVVHGLVSAVGVWLMEVRGRCQVLIELCSERRQGERGAVRRDRELSVPCSPDRKLPVSYRLSLLPLSALTSPRPADLVTFTLRRMARVQRALKHTDTNTH